MHAQFDRVLEALAGGKLPAVAAHLDAARADILAFTATPQNSSWPKTVEDISPDTPAQALLACIARYRAQLATLAAAYRLEA